MKKLNTILLAILLVQVVIVVIVRMDSQSLAVTNHQALLVDFDRGQVDRIVIDGLDQTSVTLNKDDSGEWNIQSLDGYSVDRNMINEFFDKFGNIKRGAAIADSERAKTRFKVDSESYERRLTFHSAEQSLGTVYLGTSPGIRQIHTRVDGESSIYSIRFAAHEAPPTTDAWADKATLRLKANDIREIRFSGATLRREEDAEWTIDPVFSNEMLKSAAAEKLMRLLADLDVETVHGKSNPVEALFDQAILSITVKLVDDQQIDYILGKGGDAYILKASSSPFYFGLSDQTANSLIESAQRQSVVGDIAEPLTGDDTIEQTHS